MEQELPQTLGYEVAGIVDELGEGLTEVAVGDRVFGFAADDAAQAELAVLTAYAPIPSTLDFAVAASLTQPSRLNAGRARHPGPTSAPTRQP